MMTFDDLLTNHWNIFLRHLCRFHPLEPDFLAKYWVDLDWGAISYNQKIDWTEELIARHAEHIAWPELAWNPAIIWTSELIDQFRDRLDWYYLGRNPQLPITSSFIAKELPDLWIVENNVHLTEQLKTAYGKNLLPAANQKVRQLEPRQRESLEEALNAFGPYSTHHIAEFYDRFLKDEIQRRSPEAIFTGKFDYRQRYYLLKPKQNDTEGLTPGFRPVPNPFPQLGTRGHDAPVDIKTSVVLTDEGELREGKPRLREALRVTSSVTAGTPVLAVSENVKRILEEFELGLHRFTPVQVQAKRVTNNLEYYLLEFQRDSLVRQLSFDNVGFIQRTTARKTREKAEETLPPGTFNKYEDIEDRKKQLWAGGFAGVVIEPINHLAQTSQDVFTIGADIIVNDFVRRRLEALLPARFSFASTAKYGIRIDQEVYDAKATFLQKPLTLIKEKTDHLDGDLIYFYAKMQRIKSGGRGSVGELPEDEFTEVQRKLNVIIPESFKATYRAEFDEAAYYSDFDDEDYDEDAEWVVPYVPIGKFYLEENYAASEPSTYLTLIVGDDKGGDVWGLPLLRDSDVELSEQLLYFDHETGRVTEMP